MLKAETCRGLSKAVLLFFLGGFGGPYGPALASQSPDPLSLYGNEIVFDVFREAEKVGRHKVAFSTTSARDLSVTAQLELKVTFLSIPVYKFRYQSLALWRDGRLMDLVAKVNDDGETATVRALAKGRILSVSGPKGDLEWNETLYPTNHWNAGILSQKNVLNTLSDEISQVTIASQGRENSCRRQVDRSNPIPVFRRYRYHRLIRRCRPLGQNAIHRKGWFSDGLRVCPMRIFPNA